ncbi:MAG TPA: hypothetical protein VGE16_18390 [Albitalea sp.]
MNAINLAESAAVQDVLNAIHWWQQRFGGDDAAHAAQLSQLRQENGVLARELASVQQRTTRLVQQQAHTIETLRALLVRLRADLITRDTAIAVLRDELRARDAPGR